MPTIWIHRSQAADILVDFESIIDAYSFAIRHIQEVVPYNYMIETTLQDVLNHTELPEQGIDIIHSANFQTAIIPISVTPDPSWNTDGFVKVSQEEAMLLGSDKNPEGFIPYESERVWMKETRTMAELDAELDNYMFNWRQISSAAAEN